MLSPGRRYLWAGSRVPEPFGSNLGRWFSAAIVSSAAMCPLSDQVAAEIRAWRVSWASASRYAK